MQKIHTLFLHTQQSFSHPEFIPNILLKYTFKAHNSLEMCALKNPVIARKNHEFAD